MRAWRWPLWLLFVVLAVTAAATVRPVAVRGDSGQRTLWLWAWQSGSVRFTNSVTHVPVRIDFRLGWGFDRFDMITDEKTVHYYTSGSYDIAPVLAQQRTRLLDYCSIVGMDIRLGRHRFHVADGCLHLRALWPPIPS